METRKISLAITTYNRPKRTAEAIKYVIDDQRINEIIIVDDHSTGENFENMVAELRKYDNFESKIKVFYNNMNIGMMNNKVRAVNYCTNDFAILFDSDNILPTSYVDAFFNISKWNSAIIYCPDFARPKFDYREYSGMVISKDKAARLVIEPMFATLLNTCNFIVPVRNFVDSYVINQNIKASDTIWLNYNWLKKGNFLQVVKDMQYHHAISEDSGFLEDVDYNMKMAGEIRNLISKL